MNYMFVVKDSVELAIKGPRRNQAWALELDSRAFICFVFYVRFYYFFLKLRVIITTKIIKTAMNSHGIAVSFFPSLEGFSQ